MYLEHEGEVSRDELVWQLGSDYLGLIVLGHVSLDFDPKGDEKSSRRFSHILPRFERLLRVYLSLNNPNLRGYGHGNAQDES